jgi:hypothetical protein
MAEQRVMGPNGHDTYAFEKSDIVSVEAAQQRFNDLAKRGIWVEPGENGADGRVLKAFDPDVKVMRFQPHLQAG